MFVSIRRLFCYNILMGFSWCLYIKGVLHTTGGYMVYTATTFKYAFDYKPKDIYWYVLQHIFSLQYLYQIDLCYIYVI